MDRQTDRGRERERERVAGKKEEWSLWSMKLEGMWAAMQRVFSTSRGSAGGGGWWREDSWGHSADGTEERSIFRERNKHFRWNKTSRAPPPQKKTLCLCCVCRFAFGRTLETKQEIRDPCCSALTASENTLWCRGYAEGQETPRRQAASQDSND